MLFILIFSRATPMFKPQALKGATKLYFTHYSCVVIVLFNTSLDKSSFSTFSFEKLVLCIVEFSVFSSCSVFRFHLHKLHNIYVIIIHIGCLVLL